MDVKGCTTRATNHRVVPHVAAVKEDMAQDPCRFYCPYPGCTRSFAELWRLKVHYRAAPDVRGSGKERGHGMELGQCPKCNEVLKPGKHHIRCSGAVKKTTRKRSRNGAVKNAALLPTPSPTSSAPSATMSSGKTASTQHMIGSASPIYSVEEDSRYPPVFIESSMHCMLPRPEARDAFAHGRTPKRPCTAALSGGSCPSSTATVAGDGPSPSLREAVDGPSHAQPAHQADPADVDLRGMMLQLQHGAHAADLDAQAIEALFDGCNTPAQGEPLSAAAGAEDMHWLLDMDFHEVFASI